MDPNFAKRVESSSEAILEMVEDGRWAQAAAFMYFTHKLHILEWVIMKRILLSKAISPTHLQTIALILEASKKSTLAESARLIPGLCDYFHENLLTELLD
jgi:hypothetical protein